MQSEVVLRHDRLDLETPLATALLGLTGKTKASFHALPIGFGRSIENGPLSQLYAALYGNILKAETTITGPYFDNFFFPESAIRDAERLAARAFSADDTLFITTGTTIANRIAIETLLTEPGTRVLADKGVHQSIHFGLSARRASVDYLVPKPFCPESDRAALSLDEMIDKLAAAEREGRPYRLLVFNGQTYDGVLYDMATVLTEVALASPSLQDVLIDEAWGGWSYFHPLTRRHAALHAARTVGLNVVSTQSAHKSMSALRQASFLHCVGEHNLGKRLRGGRYRHHTTSPSYPILASLDLARAQMTAEGRRLIDRAIHLTGHVSNVIAADPDLTAFAVNADGVPAELRRHVALDPTKLSFRAVGLPIGAQEIRNLLYRDYGLYVNRCTQTSLLLNFHIGIREEDVEALLDALRRLQRRFLVCHDDRRISTSFVIPYPPGVPIVVPGDPVDDEVLRRISAVRLAGTRIFTVEADKHEIAL